MEKSGCCARWVRLLAVDESADCFRRLANFEQAVEVPAVALNHEQLAASVLGAEALERPPGQLRRTGTLVPKNFSDLPRSDPNTNRP